MQLIVHVRPEEPEANAFASELLMPELLFKPRCTGAKPSVALIEQLAGAFSTTLSATALRYIENTDLACAVVFSEDGSVKWFYPSDDFPAGLDRYGPLHRDTYAFDVFNGKTPPTEMRDVPAHAWLSAPGLKPRSTIKEESRALPRYNAALSLLWADENVFMHSDDEDPPEHDPDHFTPNGRRWRW